MLGNASSTYSNDPYLHFHSGLSSNNNCFPFELCCLIQKPGSFIFTTFTCINILLLLPLYIFILYQGVQRWSSAAVVTSHSDTFTYHLVIMELINVFGCVLCCFGIYKNDYRILMVWFYLSSIPFYGETFIQLLTCVEHYLAVVHPTTYMSLRKERWIRIRNVIIGCIWLLCCGWTSLITIGNSYLFADAFFFIISVIIISFCSLSVLCVLNRPGPGEQGRKQAKVDPSKQRAFYTIVAIMGVLMLRCAWSLVGCVHSVLYGWMTDCALNLGGVWINLPGSLVLPLLFIQRNLA